MKKLIIALILYSFEARATNYYVDNGFTGTSTGSESAPFKNIADVNAKFPTLNGGDAVLFKRGKTFYGALIISKSGASSTSKITIGAYGTGADPIITGWTYFNGWAAVSGRPNVYRVSAPELSGITELKMVAWKDKVVGMGRWPNYTFQVGFEGWQPIDAVKTSSIERVGVADTIYDAPLQTQWSNGINYTGSDVIVKTHEYANDRSKITSHSGNRIIYPRVQTNYRPKAGWGYFIQAHLSTLDIDGEWYWDDANNYLYFYNSSGPPVNGQVKAASISRLVYSKDAASRSNITIKDINFQGANTALIELKGASSANITIDNCDFSFSYSGILLDGTGGLRVQNGSILNSLSTAVNMGNSPGAVVSRMFVRNVEKWPGLGPSANGSTALSNGGDGSVTEFCTVDSCGYIAIKYGNNNCTVRNNYVNAYSLIKQDGGAIYGRVGREIEITSGLLVKGNIVLNGIGSLGGVLTTTRNVHGIYFDDGLNGFICEDNYVENAARSGIYAHNNFNCIIRNNTLYDNKLTEFLLYHDNLIPAAYIRNFTVTGNIFVGLTATAARTMNIGYNPSSSSDGDVSRWGTWNNNVYAHPMDENQSIVLTKIPGYTSTRMSLSGWRTFSNGKDGASTITPIPVSSPANQVFGFKNPYGTAATVSFHGVSYVDARNVNLGSTGITLQPYTSRIIFKAGSASATKPTIQYGDVVIVDDDNDGVANSIDNCVSVYNPNQADTDNDGIGDACDAASDTDGDGVNDASDNCPSISNPGQADADNDGIGDVCEADSDGDAVIDDNDNCPLAYNPDQLDIDNDGIGDVCDVVELFEAPFKLKLKYKKVTVQ